MKNTLLRTALALALTALLGGAALADTKTKNIRFEDDVTLSGTLIKKGTYKLTFDDQTNELSIIRGGKVLAKAPARLEENKSAGSRAAEYKTRTAEGNMVLTSVKIGDAYAVIGGEGSAAAVQ